jgi:phosphate transport system substrate-binding protein
VKFTRSAQVAALAVAGTLALAACGSNNNSSTTPGGDGGTIGGAACASGTLKASGSTAQANAMNVWIKDYQTACTTATINYQANGSGSGVTDFINKQTQFAGSDSALKDADQTSANARCAPGQAINIPMVGGGIAVAYNLTGVSKLILTPAVIAEIFAGKITKWNDPVITALNPGVNLPSATIAQFHRSDSSGTTDNFTKYLIATAPTVWTYTGGKAWTAPGGQGAKGSDGVGAALKSTPNSIGYIELSFATQNNLETAWINGGTTPVAATSANAATTISTATVTGTGDNLTLKIDYKAPAPAYPLVLVTYEIACQSGNDASTLPLLKGFLTYTASDAAQSELTSSGYVPITGELLTKVRSAIGAIS